MYKVKKLCAEDDSSSFGCLPEDVVLQILNKLVDLKTLCLYTPSLGSYGSAIGSLMTFQCVKSLHIQLPSLFDNHILFKWKVNPRIRPKSFIFLFPNSVCNTKESNVNANSQEAQEEQYWDLVEIMWECLKDVSTRVKLLLHVTRLPLLENVVITDSGKRGQVSHCKGKDDDLIDWISSSSDEIIEKIYSSYFVTRYCVPFLKLPVSGYLMEGVTLYILQWKDPKDDIKDSFMKSDNDDFFEDKEEAAYGEALMEILKKHSDRIQRVIL